MAQAIGIPPTTTPRGDAAPLVIPPPPPPERADLRRALRCFREVMQDSSKTDVALEMFQAFGGDGDEVMFQRFVRDARGRALLRDRPCLVSALADRDGLAAMPTGSLGSAYLAFAERNGFAADGLVQISVEAFAAERAASDPHRLYFYDRFSVMHDLWHVLTGYDTDEPGEAMLLGFSHPQGLTSRGARFALLAAFVFGRAGIRRRVGEAWRRGRRAAPLMVQPYEALLALPIDEVRARLRIDPIARSHPAGIVRQKGDVLVVVRA